MKATLREFGGPIDPTGRRARVVDSGLMTQGDGGRARETGCRGRGEPPDADSTAGRGRDLMTYSITIEQDGQVVVLKQSDATRTQGFIELQDWIRRERRTSVALPAAALSWSRPQRLPLTALEAARAILVIGENPKQDLAKSLDRTVAGGAIGGGETGRAAAPTVAAPVRGRCRSAPGDAAGGRRSRDAAR